MIRRILDASIAAVALIVLFPFLVLIGLSVAMTSRGGMFYVSKRIGLNGKPFKIFKFRTMVPGADKSGSLNVPIKDDRITPVGRFLRTTKLDELPQFYNVLIGDLALIGPRADIPEYIEKVPEEKKNLILSIKPGLSDWASLFAFSQYADFANVSDPDAYHVKYIHPIKLTLQEYYVRNRSLAMDAHIFILTALRMVKINLGVPAPIRKIIDETKQSICNGDVPE